MSKILRRPMFRGGPVDSRGTGITSGLYDGGRVGYNQGNLVAPLYTANTPITSGKSLMDLATTRFNSSLPFSYQLSPINTKTNLTSNKPEETEEVENIKVTDDLEYFSGDSDFEKPPGDEGLSDLAQLNLGQIDRDEYNRRTKIKEDKEKLQSQQVDTGDFGVEEENIANLDKGEAALQTNKEAEEKVELSAQDLIKENAELFKELLNEGQKEDIKKARISDASDYLLKFFEGSQKEGATVGSAAADVAGFATSKPSATERAREAKKKTDQTAVALAINDYVAGKRSKESIQQALALSAAKIKLAEGTLGDKILKAKGSGPVTVTVIRDVLRSEPEYSGKSIEEFNSKDKDFTGLKYVAGDENKIFIDKITKETFIYDPSIKSFKRIY